MFEQIIAAVISFFLSLFSGGAIVGSSVGSSNPPTIIWQTKYDSMLEKLPEKATKATPQQVDHILASTWLPSKDFEKKPIYFEYVKDFDGYAIGGQVCNGFGVTLHPDRAKGTYSVSNAPVTLMECGKFTDAYESGMNAAVRQTNTFYVVDANTVFLGKDGKGIKLTRVP